MAVTRTIKVRHDTIKNAVAGRAGVRLIEEERKRQVEQEGWDASHDDDHADGAIAVAAAKYALPAARRKSIAKKGIRLWPWASKWWKPTPDDRIRELTKAGALIAAEIDRLVRARK